MATHRIKFVGPATMAISVATDLAEADGVDLVSSEPPSILDEKRVELRVVVEGPSDAIAGAVSTIRREIPRGASIEILDAP